MNARSLKSAHKMVEIVEQMSKFDLKLVVVTETWLDDSVTDAMLLTCPLTAKSLNYCLIRKDRDGRIGGGVCMFISKIFTVSVKEIPICFSDLEVICADVRLKKWKARFVCVYNPDRELVRATKIYDCLSYLCSGTSNPVFIFGDFNLPKIDWTSLQYPKDGVHDVFMDCFAELSLEQCVFVPTRETNTLDLLLTSHPNLVSSVDVTSYPFPTGSDHNAVYFDLYICMFESKPKEKLLSWKNAKYREISDFLETLNWNVIFEPCLSINDFYTEFKSVMCYAIEIFVPTSVPRKLHGLTLPKKILKLRKQKRKLWENRDVHINGRAEFNACSRKVCELIREYRSKQETKFMQKGPAYFYRFCKSKLKNNHGVPPLADQKGELCYADFEKCELLNTYFSSVFVTDNDVMPAFVKNVPQNIVLANVTFDPHSVCQILKKLPDKACKTPDNLPAVFLKRIAKLHKIGESFDRCICNVMCRIFTASMNLSDVPDDWRLANVIPLFKKGRSSSVNNYRPVSLTSVVCKVMETAVNRRLMSYLNKHALITRDQHGFRCRKSVATQLLESATVLIDAYEQNQCLDVIYYDFRKAFDTVCHEKLLFKLKCYGISGLLLSWIKAFLSHRFQRVVIGKSESNFVPASSGVPQGSVVGPSLFIIFINDVPDALDQDNCDIKFFADDMKMFGKVSQETVRRQIFSELPFNCVEDFFDLYKAVNALCVWASDWQLSLAGEKCVVMHYGKNNPGAQYTIDGVNLCSVKTVRDLGVQVSCDYKWSVHCENVSKKGLKLIGIIFRALTTKQVDLLLNAYVTFIRPVLEYSSVVWSPYYKKDIESIERVQHVFTLRVFQRCFPGERDISYKDRCFRLSLDSLELRRLRTDLQMCYKILNGFIDVDEKTFFVRNTNRTLSGHHQKLFVPSASSDVKKACFSFRIVSPWNGLPNSVVSCTTAASFIANLKNVDLTGFLKCHEF